MPKVLNKYHFVANKIPKDAVNIMRPGKWGNPFAIGRDGGSRAVVCDMYDVWILNETTLLKDLHELRGKDLLCCCKPARCHGDTLLRLANG